MFSNTVSENRNVSCGTMPIARRSDASESCRTSWPSISTWPEVASKRRGIRWTRELLPAPVGPTIATVLPAGIARVMPRSTGVVS